MEDLQETLHRLLAAKVGTSPELLTPELVQEWYEKEIEPGLRFEPQSEYGGWNPTGLRFVSQCEMEEITKEVEEFEEEILRKSKMKKR